MTEPARYFTCRDMARARSAACEGCGECCRGMGDTIVLDPYDADRLAKGLGKPFSALLNEAAALHVDDGLVLPHLAMKKSSADPDGQEACSFLGDDGRCRIHAFRPGICRLYPLAREFGEKEIRYFLLPDACPKGGRHKVRIDRYLELPEIGSYEAFKLAWHHFLKDARKAALETDDQERKTRISLKVLEVFYLAPYPENDFYAAAELRMERVRRVLLKAR